MTALAENKYDFRTVRGVAEETGLEPEVVKGVLNKYTDEVRVAAVPNAKGETLYTLRSRAPKLRERLSEALAFMAGSGQ